MPHFSKDVIDGDPEGLERLREILHEPPARARADADRSGPADQKSGVKFGAGPGHAGSLGTSDGRRRENSC